MKKCWTIPAKANGEFVARMEDVHPRLPPPLRPERTERLYG